MLQKHHIKNKETYIEHTGKNRHILFNDGTHLQTHFLLCMDKAHCLQRTFGVCCFMCHLLANRAPTVIRAPRATAPVSTVFREAQFPSRCLLASSIAPSPYRARNPFWERKTYSNMVGVSQHRQQASYCTPASSQRKPEYMWQVQLLFSVFCFCFVFFKYQPQYPLPPPVGNMNDAPSCGASSWSLGSNEMLQRTALCWCWMKEIRI